MRRRSLTSVVVLLAFIVSLVATTSAAQAIVINANGTSAGVALMPGSTLPSTITRVTASTPCQDPWLTVDLHGPLLPANGLCFQGGSVMHGNETFAITWDPDRSYWAGTRNYVEQFLRDVADGSNTLSSPYAVTTQYRDGTGRAGNNSLYGGGCIDYGNVQGGLTCQFPHAIVTGAGQDYPSCPVGVNAACTLTDAGVRRELQSMIGQMGLQNHVQQGFTPLIVVLTPGNVQLCLVSSVLCSASPQSAAKAPQFCSYHSHITVGDTDYAYVVQPWTAYTACDEPNLPVPVSPDPAIDVGIRLVSPVSAGQIAAIVDPTLNGWFANDGSEINDNLGCAPQGFPILDKAIVGTSAQNPYYLQPEFNNAGVLEFDPYAPRCAHEVALTPRFVVPSPIDQGDVVAFDGSVTHSTLIVPTGIVPPEGYFWNFGDGTTSVGPSVVHAYAQGGTYSVKLTVTDRGGNTASISQTITVIGPVAPTAKPGLKARLLLMPQGLKTVLHSGVSLLVSSNEPADGIATLSISRSAAERAHIAAGRGPSVVIARGTVSGIPAGTIRLRLRLSPAVAAKLKHLHHVVLTVRFALVAAGGKRVAIDAAGHY